MHKYIKSYIFQNHEPSATRVVQYQAPIYFANADMFVKAITKSSGVDPVKLKKMKKKLEQRKEILVVKVNLSS